MLRTRHFVPSGRPSGRLSGLGVGLAALVLALVTLAPRAAQAQKGKIVVSEQEFGSYGSDKEMTQAIKKLGKTTFKGDGSWTLNFMVFLNAAPGANQINIVYYDVTGKRSQVNFSEVGVKPDQKIVLLNGQTISKEMGFQKGHRYDVLATRLVGGKEKVYAKGTITLK
jgi:hypothetical protein